MGEYRHPRFVLVAVMQIVGSVHSRSRHRDLLFMSEYEKNKVDENKSKPDQPTYQKFINPFPDTNSFCPTTTNPAWVGRQ